jgi:hypothetical protein
MELSYTISEKLEKHKKLYREIKPLFSFSIKQVDTDLFDILIVDMPKENYFYPHAIHNIEHKLNFLRGRTNNLSTFALYKHQEAVYNYMAHYMLPTVKKIYDDFVFDNIKDGMCLIRETTFSKWYKETYDHYLKLAPWPPHITFLPSELPFIDWYNAYSIRNFVNLCRDIKNSPNNIGIQHLCIAYNTKDDTKFSEEDVNEYLKSASIILGRKLI